MRFLGIFSLLFFCVQGYLLGDAALDEPPGREQGMYQTFIMLGLALAFFYLIMWRPEQKRRKALEQQRAALKQGDRVSAMGIIGTILRINDNTVIVKMYDGSKLEFYKGAITDILPADEETSKSE